MQAAFIYIFLGGFSAPSLASDVFAWVYGDSVGIKCYSNRDCQTARARCFNGMCKCLSTHIFVKGECLPKIRPGQSPCKLDEQCQAFWPGTHCVNTICQCQTGVHVKTRDGIVCVDYEACPLGDKNSVLRDADGSVADCHIAPSGFMSGCQDQLHMYDCIKDKRDGVRFYCCPNKANTCSQPMDQGEAAVTTIAPAIRRQEVFRKTRFLPWYLRSSNTSAARFSSKKGRTRYYFNRILGECQPFEYLGSGGNANNFKTLEHCENHCKTTCLRGSPLFQTGPNGGVHQYLQRQQMCSPKEGCGEPQYNCDVVQPGRALCCPNRDFLCSNLGGSPQRQLDTPYDTGIFCNENRQTLTRYYYDRSSQSCLSFQYKGCSGNFNNFERQSDCEEVCIRQRVLLKAHEQDHPEPFQYIWRSTHKRYFG